MVFDNSLMDGEGETYIYSRTRNVKQGGLGNIELCYAVHAFCHDLIRNSHCILEKI